MPPIDNTNVVVPTFELLCSSSGLTFTSVYLCVVWRTVWEELCVGGAVGGAVWGSCGRTVCGELWEWDLCGRSCVGNVCGGGGAV